MANFTVKTFDQILGDMVTWIIANAPGVTDMTPGSIIRSYCEGAALSMEEIYVASYLGFKRYLDNIQETVFDFPRKAGTKASVNVVFSRAVVGAEVTILAGTRLKTVSGLRFILDNATKILYGETASASVSVTADEVGSSYNVGSGTIIIQEDITLGVDTVTNALAATGGINSESNVAYKNRFQLYMEGLGRNNIAGLTAGALSVEGITSASVVELFPPVAGVNVDLYVDDGTATSVTSAKLLEVQTVIDGDGSSTYPGYRSAGVRVEVKQPGIITQNVSATLSILGGVDSEQLLIDVVDAISTYINSLGIGSDILYNEIVASIMGVFGVVDVDVTVPSANVTISPTQVGRVGVIALTGV